MILILNDISFRSYMPKYTYTTYIYIYIYINILMYFAIFINKECSLSLIVYAYLILDSIVIESEILAKGQFLATTIVWWLHRQETDSKCHWLCLTLYIYKTIIIFISCFSLVLGHWVVCCCSNISYVDDNWLILRYIYIYIYIYKRERWTKVIWQIGIFLCSHLFLNHKAWISINTSYHIYIYIYIYIYI